MKFSFEWIKELGKLKISANEAADLLNAKACETELTEDGNLEADILPNRPDLLSHIGLARELAALTDVPFGEQGADFILGSDGPIPVTIDETAPRDLHIRLGRLQAIDFRDEGSATKLFDVLNSLA